MIKYTNGSPQSVIPPTAPTENPISSFQPTSKPTKLPIISLLEGMQSMKPIDKVEVQRPENPLYYAKNKGILLVQILRNNIN